MPAFLLQPRGGSDYCSVNRAFAAAEGKTCSDRLRVCQGYFAKSRGDSPACHAECVELRQERLSSGCWESKIVAKECGFAGQ
jgi:hypothetical protein